MRGHLDGRSGLSACCYSHVTAGAQALSRSKAGKMTEERNGMAAGDEGGGVVGSQYSRAADAVPLADGVLAAR